MSPVSISVTRYMTSEQTDRVVETPGLRCNYTCNDEVFEEIATSTEALRDCDKEEILNALHLAWHSPGISEFERVTLRRTSTLLELSWNDGWRLLCVVRSPHTRRVFDILPTPNPEVWRYAEEHKSEHESLLLRGATHLRSLRGLLNERIALPFPSWLHMAGELRSRESHWTLHGHSHGLPRASAER